MTNFDSFSDMTAIFCYLHSLLVGGFNKFERYDRKKRVHLPR